MVIITAMLCMIFGMLYHFTKVNLENESIAAMRSMADKPINNGPPGQRREDFLLPYFSVQLSIHGEPLSVSGYYDLSDTDLINKAVEAALDTGREIGKLDRYNLRFCRNAAPFGQTLVFVDMSAEQATLYSLVQTSVIIGTLSFVAFLCISVLLAKWAVKPVDKAWKQQQQFVSDASHELKTPLTVIMANAELLEQTASEESRKQYVSGILTMSRQMRRLLEQMLELTRADSGQDNRCLQRIDLSQLVYDTLLPFEPVFFEKNLLLESTIAPGIWVEGDAAQLRQVLEILLDNAQKYAADSGKTHVVLQTAAHNRCLLYVANEGDPIPPEHLENLFKRFYRQNAARTRDGSFGLGLSIAEGIVQAHKGKIWAQSRNGYNTFFVELAVLP